MAQWLSALVLKENLSWGDSTLDREPIIDQSMDTTKVQFGESMSFIGFTYRSRNDSRQMHHQSPFEHGQWFKKLGTCVSAAQWVRGCPFQVLTSFGPNLFQAAGLVLESSLQLWQGGS